MKHHFTHTFLAVLAISLVVSSCASFPGIRFGCDEVVVRYDTDDFPGPL